jgi:hypothetical protein
MKNKSSKATSNLIDALFLNDVCNDTPGPEWFTVWDIVKKYNISRSHASRKITTLIKKGKIEMKKFRIVIDLSSRVVPHYKPVK